MSDKTVTARMKRQRELRAAEGWLKVTVWVPTPADAEAVKKLASERRRQAEDLAGLSEEVSQVNDEMAGRIALAIAQHGSTAYTTPSGPVLELMSQLASEGDLTGFSNAFVIIARAKPANAKFIAARVPAKISDFLVRHRGIRASAFTNWTASNPGWADDLQSAVRDPERFEQVVEAMANAINRSKPGQERA